MKRFVIVAGTRPEIIKVAPIIRKLIDRKKNLNLFILGNIMIISYQLKLSMI